MAIILDQNAGRCHNKKTDNKSKVVDKFIYLGTTLRTQNSIQEDIKC
jgi:hypothetical protein